MLTKDALEKQRSTFSATKQALLEKRLRGDSAQVTTAATISRRPDAEFAPTTFSQQRLWFLDQLNPGTATYNIPIALRIHGKLSIPALEQCFHELARRHETWRTTFVSRDGIPIQRINPPRPVDLTLLDLADRPKDCREQEAIHQATAFAQVPFDMTAGPLVRILLAPLQETEHLLLLVQHHSISDGWSVGVVLQEIPIIYEAFLMQKPSPLPDLTVQYADYAYWQQQRLQGQELERQLIYWKDQLADAPPSLDLPTRRNSVQTSRGETHFFHLSRQLSDALRLLCQREGVTLFMTLLASFQTLLYRYTSQEDLILSTSVANRPQPELEPIIGFFVNILILRTDLGGDPSFRELLKRVREVSLAAFAHQEVPFERAVPRPPVLQAHFILQNTPSQSKEIAGLSAERIELENNTAKFDLFLNVEDADEIYGFFEYNADLFDVAMIRRMDAHFQRLLEAVVQHPEMRLSTFPLLSPQERTQLLHEWNTTHFVNERHGCLHVLFEEQVGRTPLQSAVEFDSVSLTYQELNERANQAAHYLRSLGVGPETPVALCLERSIDLMVAILGILKAGGIYLPLDPFYPGERLGWILADAQVPLLLTHSSILPRLPEHSSRAICIDTSKHLLTEMAITNPVHLTTEENAAYIIYTSGSTGQPKGVIITHRAIINHSQAIAREYNISETDRILQFASASFDEAGEEIYPTWLSGATLVLRPEYLPANVEELHGFIERERLTILHLPTAFWHQWVTQLSTTPTPLPACLRLINVGGEQVQPELYNRWQHSAGTQVQWSNTYGPTEATITSILYTSGKEEMQDTDQAPIGYPLANMQAYVLDQHLQPVPLGAIGEIFLGGAGLARGYLNRPELTADRFIPNPYGPAGTRLYRTGDLARYLADGSLLYVGRGDQQVKIRGYRIELGEIESILLQHPQVRACIVIAREETPGDKYLAAYIIGNQPEISSAEIHRFLSTRLPKYMLPASYTSLPHFPVTTSGKINRSVLPVPTRERDDRGETYVQPRTPFEEVLADIWSDVLHIQQVGIYDNFFDIGGHSLRAIQLVARIQEIFPIDLPLRQIFESPTIAGLAERLLQDEQQQEIIVTATELFQTVSGLSDEEVETLLNN